MDDDAGWCFGAEVDVAPMAVPSFQLMRLSRRMPMPSWAGTTNDAKALPTESNEKEQQQQQKQPQEQRSRSRREMRREDGERERGREREGERTREETT